MVVGIRLGSSLKSGTIEPAPTASACDHFVPVFPLIPAYSRSEFRNYLDFLRVRSGFEPEGRGLRSACGRLPSQPTAARESLPACR